MKTWEYAFTVFTPTFNRAHTLDRVYESLRRQTCRDFEWLIVDDGSTDGTAGTVERWQREADFPIRYLWQENQGKHVAFNLGVRNAKGVLFLTLDSDDACVPEALERFKHHWDAIPSQHRESFAGVVSLCVDHNGKQVGTRFPHDVTDCSLLDVTYRYKVKGEKWALYRTDVLSAFPFPEVVKKHYVPEGIVWSRIARSYKMRFVNEPLRIYFVDRPSLVHGGRPGKNALGGRMYHLMVLNEDQRFFRYAPLQLYRSAVLYVRGSLYLAQPPSAQALEITNIHGRVLWALAWPLGYALYRWETRGLRGHDQSVPAKGRGVTEPNEGL